MKLTPSAARHRATPDFDAELARAARVRAAQDRRGDRARVAAILADVRARGDAAVLEYTRRFDRLDGGLGRRARDLAASELRAALDGAAAQRSATRCEAARGAHPRVTTSSRGCGAVAGATRDADGTRARPAGDAARPRRHLRAGRQGGVSVVGADERDAGAGGRRAARSSWWCRRPTASATRWCWPRRALAGVDRVFTIGGAQAVARARLRHRDGARGRQDRRPGQRLRRRGQAPRVRHGRHRHDRRAVARSWCIADGTRRPDWVAMDLFSQAEHDELGAGDPAVPRRRLHRRASQPASSGCCRRMPRRDIIARVARRPRRADPDARPGRGLRDRQPHRARAPRARGRASPQRWLPKIAPRRRDFPRRTTRRESARRLLRRARTTCCRPSRTARFSSPLGVYDFQKRSQRDRVSARPARRRSAPIAAELAHGEGLQAHARAAEMRLAR